MSPVTTRKASYEELASLPPRPKPEIPPYYKTNKKISHRRRENPAIKIAGSGWQSY